MHESVVFCSMCTMSSQRKVHVRYLISWWVSCNISVSESLSGITHLSVLIIIRLSGITSAFTRGLRSFRIFGNASDPRPNPTQPVGRPNPWTTQWNSFRLCIQKVSPILLVAIPTGGDINKPACQCLEHRLTACVDPFKCTSLEQRSSSGECDLLDTSLESTTAHKTFSRFLRIKAMLCDTIKYWQFAN